MRVLVLALAVAFVAGYQGNFAPEFTPRQTYVYNYEGYLLGGLPEEGLARAGVKIRSKVLIRREADNFIRLKFESPEIFEYSGIWPKDAFRPATKLTSALSAQLLTPIKFEYANGVVGKVYAPAAVSETVVNLYRGILDIFQMNIKKTQNVYDLQELGVQGVCKTQYTVRDDSKDERIYLTKTKDLNMCQEQIVKDTGLEYAEKCVECVNKGKALKGASAFNYVLRPEANSAKILEATVREIFQFSLFNIMNQAAQMESKLNLTFVELNNNPVELLRAEYLPRGSLQYQFSNELYQTPYQLLRRDDARIEDLLSHLVTSNIDKVHEEAPLKFLQLIQMLRQAKYEQLESLWNQYRERKDYRYWILSAIPSIRQHTALRFLKEKFLASEFTPEAIIVPLMTSIQWVNPTLDALRITEEMMKDNKFRQNQVLRSALRLGYGTLVRKYCQENPACPVELVKPANDVLPELVEKREYDEVISVLKLLGNAGHPASRKSIQKLLPGFGNAASSLPLKVHIEALLALRSIAKKEPKMVQETAIQVFMDRELHPELRMVAAMVLFETKLPMGLVLTLADAVLKEKQMQISSFVYSYMKSMTKSTAPDFASVAAACNVAIKLLSPRLERMNYRYSRALYFDAYSNPWMIGASASAYYINDVASVLPRSIVAKARTYLAGTYTDMVEVGVRTEGIQEAILKIRKLSDIDQRQNRMKMIMKALSQWTAEPSSQPLASLSLKVLGQEVGFANLDKTIVGQVVELSKEIASQTDGKRILEALQSGFKTHFVQPLLITEVGRAIPTAFGLPMELSLHTAAVATASLELQAEISPRPADNFHISQLLKSDISMRAGVMPSVSTHTYAVMGVNTAFFKAAVVAKANAYTITPAKIEAKLDMVKGNFKLELLPVQGIDKIAFGQFETFAVAKDMEDIKITPLVPGEAEAQVSREYFASSQTRMTSSKATSSEMISTEHDNRMPERIMAPKTFSKKMCAQSLIYGIKACAEVQSRNASYINQALLYAFVGKHDFEITVAPAAGPAVERIEIEVQVGEKAAEKIIKVINTNENEEIVEDKNVLMKLKKILAPALKNSSSSSSSSSQSSSSSRSSSQRQTKLLDFMGIQTWTSGRQSSNSSSSSSSSSSSHSSSRRFNSKSSQSSSRSSSSRSASTSKQTFSSNRFVKNHLHQHPPSHGTQNSRSSASSFESIYNKAKYLANSVAPSMTILIRAIRADHKMQGYQLVTYIDKVNSRVQFIFANLTEDNHWRICADGVVLSQHKLMAKVAWGIDCKQYKTEIIAETGIIEQNPAARLKFSWEKIPKQMEEYIKRLSKYVSRELRMERVKTVPKQIKLMVAIVSDKLINVNLRTPKRALSRTVRLPIYLPYGETARELEIYQNNWGDKISHILTKTSAAECIVTRDNVTSFNRKSFSYDKPHLCGQILAQDCTPEVKFIVLQKRDQAQDQNEIVVKIEEVLIEMYPKSAGVGVKIGGVDVDTSRPYHHPKEIEIMSREQGIVIIAPKHGLQEVFYDHNIVKVKVVDWMRGMTCGLCGRADGETKREFRTPSKRVSVDSNSYAHSWVLGGESCRDASQCLMRLESVKLEKQVNHHGQNSKCYSVEHVLRCLPGCMPVRTTSVRVGFHCVPSDSYVNHADGLSNIHEKSADLTESAEAHLACRCAAQCS